MENVLIAVPVYNRKKITELTLKQLYNNKKNNTLWVYNDYSTEYDNGFLEPFCDEVVQLAPSNKKVIKNEQNYKGMGVQHLRWHQFRYFAEQNQFDYLYLTDNDALHDPGFINQIEYLYNKYMSKKGNKLPVCLYNTVHHDHKGNNIKENEEVILRKTAPGISMFFSKPMVEKIVEILNKQKEDPIYAWDYRSQEYLSLPWITSKQSYVEHFGAGGMHSPQGITGFKRDMATNPTSYLENLREPVINYLLDDKNEKPKL